MMDERDREGKAIEAMWNAREPTEYERLRQVSPEDAGLLDEFGVGARASYDDYLLALNALARRLRELVEDKERMDKLEKYVTWSETDDPNISNISLFVPYAETLRESLDRVSGAIP
jgi:hypothetical protein